MFSVLVFTFLIQSVFAQPDVEASRQKGLQLAPVSNAKSLQDERAADQTGLVLASAFAEQGGDQEGKNSTRPVAFWPFSYVDVLYSIWHVALVVNVYLWFKVNPHNENSMLAIDWVQIILYYFSVIALPITYLWVDERSIKSQHYNNLKDAYCVFGSLSLVYPIFYAYTKFEKEALDLPEWFVFAVPLSIFFVIGLVILEVVHDIMWLVEFIQWLVEYSSSS
jgi:hypothetical protein